MSDAIQRNECSCTEQFFAIAAVYRLWQCTAARPAVCEWPDASIITLTQGKIPYEGETASDIFGGRHIQPVPGPGIPKTSGGFLKMRNEGSLQKPRVNFTIQFTLKDKTTFANYQELKDEVVRKYSQEIIPNSLSSLVDPIIFNLYNSINLIERYERKLENLVYFREKNEFDDSSSVITIFSNVNNTVNKEFGNYSSKIELIPGRLDSCSCKNLLKCPNGTSTFQHGSDKIEDCISTGNEVLCRISLIPFSQREYFQNKRNKLDIHKIGGGFENNTIGSFLLESLEIAVLTLDLSNLPNNMTYGKHYQISVYENCLPCPPRYQCTSVDNEKACSFPSKDKQHALFNECLQKRRKEVCVRRDGLPMDIVWCRDQIEKPTFDKKEFESQYLIYEEPVIDKCLSVPFFCSDRSWNYGTFRKVCQEKTRDGSKGSLYNCGLNDRRKNYKKWCNQLCCLNKKMSNLDFCDTDICSKNKNSSTNVTEKCLHLLRSKCGHAMPQKEQGLNFVMDRDVQEERNHTSPIDLFNKQDSCKLEQYNISFNVPTQRSWNPSAKTPSKTSSCCKCKRHHMLPK